MPPARLRPTATFCPPKTFCFAASRRFAASDPGPVPVIAVNGITADAAGAMARLVPLLGCGEEAAALAFDGLAMREEDGAVALALATIGAEEQVHDRLLKGLAAALPPPPADREARRAARRFHVDLGRGGPAEHLARIAAIDAAVCTILSRLLHRGSPIAAAPDAVALLLRIQRDEARHVRVSRTLAGARLSFIALNDLAAGARGALADVLSIAGDAFERLGVDPDLLDRDLRRVPNGLFAA